MMAPVPPTPVSPTAIDLEPRDEFFVDFSAVRPNGTFSKWDIMKDPLPHPHPDFEENFCGRTDAHTHGRTHGK